MKVAVIGASGYVGAELVNLIEQHPNMALAHLLVSEHNEAAGSSFSSLHPKFRNVCEIKLEAFSLLWFAENITKNEQKIDAVFFATPHEYSAQWAQPFIDAGIKVFDLSGGFRLKNAQDYPRYYNFTHQNEDALAKAVYGLAEWNAEQIASAEIIAVPGCYPTASLLSLKPLIENNLQQQNSLIVVNGISGVSGAGRKALLSTSFNEVSLTPYNILQHRHQPEISQEAKVDVIFNPHLAPFKRGLLVTVTLNLATDVSAKDVSDAFKEAYQYQPMVRLLATWPKIDHVATTPFADIYWQVDEEKHVVVVSCAIDNLLKGAAAQAIQCANLSLGLASECGLVQGNLHA